MQEVDNEIQPKPKKTRTRKILKVMWIAFVCLIGTIGVLFIMIYNGLIGYMPDVEELKNPKDKFASVLYTADGQEMGRYYDPRTGNRVYADFDEISPHVVDALVSTEDSRYFDHSGIDMRAMGRVLFKTVLMRQKNAGGGSTITQQLAKQLYSPPSQGLLDRALQKPIEWMIAVKLERLYSKDEILKMYLNQFDFLNNAVGIRSAAQVYFGKDPKDLNIQESATLVGMVKNPAIYNPLRNLEGTRQRRNVVLEQMYKADKITKAQLDSLQELPLELNYHRVDHKEGIAPYFRMELKRVLTAKKPNLAAYLKDGYTHQRFVDDSIAWATNPLYGWIEKNPKPDGTKYNLYTDGLKIYTSIDSRMQRYAEEAVTEHLSELQGRFFKEKKGSKSAPYSTNRTEISQSAVDQLIANAMKNTDRYRTFKKAGWSHEQIMATFDEPRKMEVFTYAGVKDITMTPRDSVLYAKHFLRAGFMSMDSRTGEVKAYVGGPDFRFFQYDMVSTGRRQIGSTIKPFLYTYAMEEDFTPCDVFLNSQPTLYDESGRPWSPRNSGSARVGEMVDLYWALTNSNNWISARLMNELSPAQLVRNMHTLGITNEQIDPVISLCLGPCEVSVKEMVTAYSAFSNKGLKVDPVYVTDIADANGNTIAEFTPDYTQAISENAYYKMLSMLQNVINNGTGSRLRRIYGIQADMGGKTGTTNYNADGWFMGFTPQLVSGTWVGGDERYIHFNNMRDGQGAEMALPIYGKYIRKVYGDSSLPYDQNAKFEFPANFSPCYREYYGETISEEPEESIEDVFD